MTAFSFEHFGRALVITLAVCGNFRPYGSCENPEDKVVEDKSENSSPAQDSESPEQHSKVSEHPPHIMVKLKNTMKMTDKLLNSMLGDLLISPRRDDKEQSAVETMHTAGKDVEENVESKSLMPLNRSESDDMLDAARRILDSTQKNKHREAYELLERASNLGHNPSKLEIAWKVLLGDFNRNLSEAKKTFLDLGELGEPEAHMALGFLHAAGITEEGNQARALVHYMLGALGGNIWALMVLGYRYKTGTSVAMNCEKSLQFYEKAAKAVVHRLSMSGGHIVHRVRLVDLEENGNHNTYWLEADLLQYYEYLAVKGDVNAQITLGQLYFHGLRGCPKDLRKAKYYFGLASKRDHPTAWGYLGRIFLEDIEAERGNNSALDFFKKAAKQNNPIGLTGLGMMYLEGIGVEMDLKKAKTYFLQAADLGWMEGQLQLGVMYLNGVGVKQDFRSALKYFHLAAQSGHVLAYYYLAEMHAHGYGILRSCSIAVELYKSVAERGKWSEYLVTGYSKFQAGKYFHAFIVYALLAELGYEVAQSNAAYMLEKGFSGLRNITDEERYFRAFNYWRRSAHQGYSQAYVKMGDYYYYGLGVSRDFEAAAGQYRMASNEFGNPQALFNIGYMHEHGLGMPRDLALAKRFYDLAATVSQDAHVPVYLCLIKLAAIVFFEYIVSETPKFYSELVKQWESGMWDLYVLFFLVSSLLFLLTRRA